MSHLTRRDFFATTSLAAAGLAFGNAPHSLSPSAGRALLSTRFSRLSQPATSWLPESLGETDLRVLATQAVDAAKSAGATYADIRVAERQELILGLSNSGQADPWVTLVSRFDYGIRARVHGGTAFLYGSIPTTDAVARTAQQAVATARGIAALVRQEREWAPAPAATGTWTSPIQIDPFTVPIAAQVDLMHAMRSAAVRVLGGDEAIQLKWSRERRVFGSTDGTLLTQTFYHAWPSIAPSAQATLFPRADVPLVQLLPQLGPQTGGYEVVLLPELQDQIKAATEVAARYSTLPVGSFDVGRFPVVFDGITLGTIVGTTLGQALQLDRVLGHERDAGGLSYLAPPLERLGTMITDPRMTLTMHRAMPSPHAAQWDDDGVESAPVPLIRDGYLVDYGTSRATASHLTPWYQRQGLPVRSNGCAMAPSADAPVLVYTPHLVMHDHAHSLALDELCAEVSHGVLVMHVNHLSTDPQFSSGLIGDGTMFELSRGKIVRRLHDTCVQFNMRNFWKHLTALGDRSTVRDTYYGTWKGNPWRLAPQTATAPAALFADVDMIATNRQRSA